MKNGDIFLIEQDVINEIKKICDHRHWSLYRLAKESGLPYSSLNNIFSRGTCPSIPTLSLICHGFGITLSEFFDQINREDSGREKEHPRSVDYRIQLSEDEEDVIYMYRTLSKSDRKLLEAYLKGLCKKL